MLFDQFVKATTNYWSQYLSAISRLVTEGRIYATNNGRILYPTILLCTETPNHFIAELIGSHPAYNGLSVKRHKEISTNRYFNQFSSDNSKAFIEFNADGPSRVSGCILTNDIDRKEVEKRFPFVIFANSTVLIGQNEAGAAIQIGEDNHSLTILNSILINTHPNAIRVKAVRYLIVLRKSLSKPRYLELLPQKIRKEDGLLGVLPCNNEQVESLIIASQFSNLYLTSKIHETTIGEFLKTHPEIFKRALGTKRFITEPYLQWIEKDSSNTDDAINPDLFIEREDGYSDIYDLTTAALNKASLTRGERKRRRFIDYVNEGIAQLTNYEEYFTYPKHQKLAWEKYEVKVKNPNLVLVIGSFENAKSSEILEASRPFKNITIIDYDTLMQLLIGSDDRITANESLYSL